MNNRTYGDLKFAITNISYTNISDTRYHFQNILAISNLLFYRLLEFLIFSSYLLIYVSIILYLFISKKT